MDEADKKQVQGICWRIVFIAVVLLAIGGVLGHLATVNHYGIKSCWNKGWAGGRCDKQWQSGCKKDMGMCKPGCMCPKCCQKAGMCKPGCTCPKCCQKAGMCKPGCTCPKCLKKAECKSDPNKSGCPMMGEKEVEPEK